MVEIKAGTHVHFVGIGGVSMSALAELLLQRDCLVSGSDRQASPLTDRLKTLGVTIYIGHAAQNIQSADLLVYTSATDIENPERVAAAQKEIPQVRRAEFLGYLTQEHPTICIAGTHGKTTTTAMVGAVLEAGELDPTILVGGIVQGFENNLKIGTGKYWVIEADEYDRSFLALTPAIAVVTTLEADHLDCYKDINDIRATFEQFVNLLPSNGCAVLCYDEPEVCALNLNNQISRITYGHNNSSQLRFEDITPSGSGCTFTLFDNQIKIDTVTLRVPGEHNVRNALAAIGVGRCLNIDWHHIKTGIESFRGVHRRFDILGTANNITVVDDYAHHPTEIRATLQAARQGWPNGRIIAAFQPHLFTRTRDFADDFAHELQAADLVYVTDIYPAREEPIPGIDSTIITNNIPNANYTPTLEALKDTLIPNLQPGDLLIVMGAGDIEKVPHQIWNEIQKNS
ncbi:MAG: UDP-N-acetylmuramate--L-alanine ligase [Candidatus Latescibacteria bacterium]|jgi:UDP-N-acetylmuramate--alanine ligase|nr:UDP-N-acetylmuramate--L-alanine ligase [Candidatus Latescibacterota bacterium]